MKEQGILTIFIYFVKKEQLISFEPDDIIPHSLTYVYSQPWSSKWYQIWVVWDKSNFWESYLIGAILVLRVVTRRNLFLQNKWLGSLHPDNFFRLKDKHSP